MSLDAAVLAAMPVGRRHLPGEPGFEEATRIWNGMIHKEPGLVIQPETPDEVAYAVGLAREHRLLLSVKGGGHNISGLSLADGGLTLDMSRMRDVAVDTDTGHVRVGAGCLLGDIDRATQQHGLAATMGFVSQTGVAGLTLGGGFGYLTRQYGYTVDSLVEVEIVTADGEVRRASRDLEPDLFWAVRGGGWEFWGRHRVRLPDPRSGARDHGWPHRLACRGSRRRCSRSLQRRRPPTRPAS